MWRALAFVAAAAVMTAPLVANAAPAGEDPKPSLGLVWSLLQLVPSPEVIVFEGPRAGGGLRWQVTPLLYSFGRNRRLSPWRSFIAEPSFRHSGSIELFVAPEYVSLGGPYHDHVLMRGGLRTHLPLIEKGEYLSWSVAGSAFYYQGHGGASYELGLYTMSGVFGLQVGFTPTRFLRSTTFTLSVRFM